MSYTLSITRRAQKELAALSAHVYRRVRDAIGGLGTTPRPSGSVKLADREGWRIRVGDYRVIYTIDDDTQTVTVVQVGHRRDVYQR